MSDAEEAACIAETARSISDRLVRLRDWNMPIDAVYLADDVAWIARQLAALADGVASDALT